MPTVWREGGFVVVIRTMDHEPPHVHVLYAGAEVKIELDPLRIGKRKGMSIRDAALARALVARHRMVLLSRWREIHGEG